jgi:hypothetical protein
VACATLTQREKVGKLGSCGHGPIAPHQKAKLQKSLESGGEIVHGCCVISEQAAINQQGICYA